jgi:cytochrome b
VWDPVVRLTHWGLATLVLIDLVNEAGANPWHRYFGYAAAGLIAIRLLWGLGPSANARLSAMLQTAAQVRVYVTRSAKTPNADGMRSPLGACMAFTLWGMVGLVIATGWMFQLERFWGDEILEALHSGAAYVLGFLVVVHVAGAVVMSVRNRQNLVKAMITGRSNLRSPD